MLRRSLHPLILALLAVLMFAGTTGTAQADNANVNYTYLIGTGFLVHVG